VTLTVSAAADATEVGGTDALEEVEAGAYTRPLFKSS